MKDLLSPTWSPAPSTSKPSTSESPTPTGIGADTKRRYQIVLAPPRPGEENHTPKVASPHFVTWDRANQLILQTKQEFLDVMLAFIKQKLPNLINGPEPIPAKILSNWNVSTLWTCVAILPEEINGVSGVEPEKMEKYKEIVLDFSHIIEDLNAAWSVQWGQEWLKRKKKTMDYELEKAQVQMDDDFQKTIAALDTDFIEKRTMSKEVLLAEKKRLKDNLLATKDAMDEQLPKKKQEYDEKLAWDLFDSFILDKTIETNRSRQGFDNSRIIAELQFFKDLHKLCYPWQYKKEEDEIVTPLSPKKPSVSPQPLGDPKDMSTWGLLK